ncbi:MAG: hypothetical protein SCALA702_08820 [Melioribacteraceae bacterium]|nr:MAG: hypothetical protein SCALA702_08820 [Melioribacteraceae bacterium]
MKFPLKIPLFLIIIFSPLTAQLDPGAINSSLAFSDISGYGNNFVQFVNPASLGYKKTNNASIFHSPAPFELKELSTSAAAVNYNFEFGNLGIAYLRYGFELYSRNSILISHGREILPSVYAGLTAEYRQLSIQNYGNTGAINILFGLTWFPVEYLSISSTLGNPFGFTYFRNSEEIETTAALGASMFITDLLKISTTLSTETARKTALGYGMEVFVHENINLRCGINNVYNMVTLGAGVNYLYAGIDYSFLMHDYLGITHQIEINFEF